MNVDVQMTAILSNHLHMCLYSSAKVSAVRVKPAWIIDPLRYLLPLESVDLLSDHKQRTISKLCLHACTGSCEGGLLRLRLDLAPTTLLLLPPQPSG